SRLEEVFVDSCSCLFFFQAEDGIRDFHVTGVQTCALPISKLRELAKPVREANQAAESFARAAGGQTGRQPQLVRTEADPWRHLEIGRASCRESVSTPARAVHCEQHKRYIPNAHDD